MGHGVLKCCVVHTRLALSTRTSSLSKVAPSKDCTVSCPRLRGGTHLSTADTKPEEARPGTASKGRQGRVKGHHGKRITGKVSSAPHCLVNSPCRRWMGSRECTRHGGRRGGSSKFSGGPTKTSGPCLLSPQGSSSDRRTDKSPPEPVAIPSTSPNLSKNRQNTPTQQQKKLPPVRRAEASCTVGAMTLARKASTSDSAVSLPPWSKN